ncbi:hypothetical protein ACFSUD_19145 [Sulfitobacter aestuarii]|uniref:Uncharacterized protein n=1 Tax=Sulfitobacter aestuarii TaxID=2161676 RepID=A0ABW5U6X6_9RHOB
MSTPKSIRQAFAEQAHAETSVRRECLPDPQKLVERGIQTKESIDWQDALHPGVPAPEPRPADLLVRQSALEAQREEHRAKINRLRENFRQRPEEARRDFSTARDYRGPEHER